MIMVMMMMIMMMMMTMMLTIRMTLTTLMMMITLRISTMMLTIRMTMTHEEVALHLRVPGTVGVSQHAADALGEVVYAQLPDPGTGLEVGEECGAVESVKAASEIYSPVTGTVTAKNEDVENGPALINANPLTEGWLFK